MGLQVKWLGSRHTPKCKGYVEKIFGKLPFEGSVDVKFDRRTKRSFISSTIEYIKANPLDKGYLILTLSTDSSGVEKFNVYNFRSDNGDTLHGLMFALADTGLSIKKEREQISLETTEPIINVGPAAYLVAGLINATDIQEATIPETLRRLGIKSDVRINSLNQILKKALIYQDNIIKPSPFPLRLVICARGYGLDFQEVLKTAQTLSEKNKKVWDFLFRFALEIEKGNFDPDALERIGCNPKQMLEDLEKIVEKPFSAIPPEIESSGVTTILASEEPPEIGLQASMKEFCRIQAEYASGNKQVDDRLCDITCKILELSEKLKRAQASLAKEAQNKEDELLKKAKLLEEEAKKIRQQVKDLNDENKKKNSCWDNLIKVSQAVADFYDAQKIILDQ